MAINLNATLKRGNGADFDIIYPKTVLAQVIGAQDALDLKINTSARGATNGVASLDSTGKVPLGQLPDAVFDSLSFYGTASATGNGTTQPPVIASALSSAIQDADTANRSPIGYYFVISAAGTLYEFANQVDSLGENYVTMNIKVGDDGTVDPTNGVGLEAGDWFVITAFSGAGTSGDPYNVLVTIINNVYETATTARYGITQLSAATNTNDYNASTNAGGLTSGGTEVITEGVLYNLMGTGNGQIARGDHNHDSTYLGISANAATASKWATARTITLNGDLSGSVSIDGSTNVTLTAEVVNGSHTHTVANITDLTASAAELNTLDGITASVTELNYTDGVTSNIQTQLNAKQATITGAATTVVSSNLTASKVLVSDAAGKIAANSVSTTTLGFLDATSSIQTQLNSKATSATTLAGYGITNAYTKTEVDTFLTNRPEIFYDTTVGAGLGDIIIDLD